MARKVKHSDPPPLLGALLREQWQAIRDRIAKDLTAAGFDDVQPAHLAVLQHPGPEGLQPGELAMRAGVTKQAMTNMLSELDAAGYLRRAPASGDGRARVVRLTPRGRELIRTIREIVRTVEREWAAQIGADRIEQLRVALIDLRAGGRESEPG